MPLETPVDDLVRQLRRVGLRPSERLVQLILAYEPAARGPLLALATDLRALEEPEPVCWGPLHALRLLGELPDVDIIPPLLGLLPIAIEDENDIPPQYWGNEVLQILGRCGAAAVPVLWAWFDDSTHEHASRGAAVQTLSYVANFAPEIRDDLVAELRSRFARETNPTLAAHLVAVLADLGVQDAYAEILAAYRAHRVDSNVMPAANARQLLLSGGQPHLSCVKHPLWERYDQHGPTYQQQ